MELVVLSGGERIALDLHIYDALAHTKEPGHISQISISFVTFAAGQSRHNSLNHIHPYEFKISRTSSPTRMKLWGFLRFGMDAHKPFSHCGHSFQNELGFQRDGNSFGSYVSNRGEERPVGLWIQRGQRSRLPARSVLQSVTDTLRSPLATRTPWQWFPKAAALPWREAFNGGQRP